MRLKTSGRICHFYLGEWRSAEAELSGQFSLAQDLRANLFRLDRLAYLIR